MSEVSFKDCLIEGDYDETGRIVLDLPDGPFAIENCYAIDRNTPLWRRVYLRARLRVNRWRINAVSKKEKGQ